MKKDFYQKKVELHKEIVSEIKTLMEQTRNRIELDDEENCSYAVIDHCGEAEEVRIDEVWVENGILWGNAPLHDKAYNLEHDGEVHLCSIDTIYEGVYEVAIYLKEIDDFFSKNNCNFACVYQ